MMSDFDFQVLPYGFRRGPLTVVRLDADRTRGVVLLVQTEHKAYELRASPKGRKLTVTEIPVLPREVTHER